MPALEQTTPFMRRAERRMVNNQLGELVDSEELFIVEPKVRRCWEWNMI